jgi:single-stranded-DNA-specific exonuclease
MRPFNWKPLYTDTIRKPDVAKLCKDLRISRIASEVLIRRGYNTPLNVRRYLYGSYKDLYSPFLFPEMLKAVARLRRAQEKKEKILVHGDYDCDGITATALVMIMLQNMNMTNEAFIPSRAMGYGLSKEGVQKAIDIGASVLITCDCGSNERTAHSMAKKAGIDVIVLDHHSYQTKPKVFAFLNPEEPAYPFKDLCGAGVAFKLMQAMATQVPGMYPENYIELAALATIADAVPLVDENRIIVKEGLKKINATSNIGLRSLLKVSSLLNRKINTEMVGFIIAPKINAPGRIDNPRKALDLLLTCDKVVAEDLARELARINKSRKDLNSLIRDEAIKMVEENYQNDCFLVLENDSWNKGVIGIVASTMVELYHKPCAIISNGYGSVRTVPEYNLLEPLKECSGLLVRWGGHPMAAGLKVKKKSVDLFRQKINEIASRTLSSNPVPYMSYDSMLKLREMTMDVVADLERLEPFGNGNPSPRFIIEDVNVARKRVTKDGQHLQVSLRDRKSIISAIGFWMAHADGLIKDQTQKFDALFSLQRSNINTVQMEIHDLKEVKLDW